MVGMTADLFAGIAVRDIDAASAWYRNFFGAEPAFLPNDVEAVWEVGEHRYVYIEQSPERAGHALLTLFVEDLDTIVAGLTARGIEPANRETYDNGVRKVIYNDPDGNELGYGGGPADNGE
jgi:catechol 2,3-dioxygenase-like lactoylglutathione lyase family enzyme